MSVRAGEARGEDIEAIEAVENIGGSSGGVSREEDGDNDDHRDGDDDDDDDTDCDSEGSWYSELSDDIFDDEPDINETLPASVAADETQETSDTGRPSTHLVPVESAALPPGLTLLVDILTRCKYFSSLWSLEAQVLAVDTMNIIMRRLATKTSVLFPQTHQLWPVLMQRFTEQKVLFSLKPPTVTIRTSKAGGGLSNGSGSGSGSGSCGVAPYPLTDYRFSTDKFNEDFDLHISRRKTLLLPPLLDLFALLALLCGDFLTMKVRQDLWPELLQILVAVSTDALAEALSYSQQQQQQHHQWLQKEQQQKSGNQGEKSGNQGVKSGNQGEKSGKQGDKVETSRRQGVRDSTSLSGSSLLSAKVP